MKTPMQELVDRFFLFENGEYQPDAFKKHFAEFYPLHLLREKQMIINAVNTTEKNAVDFCNAAVLQYWNHEGLFDVEPNHGIDYYNEKFKDNE